MPFTPNDQLELAFGDELIPQSVMEGLADDLHLRPLASSDYNRGHLACLAALTKVPDPGEAGWVSRFSKLRSIPETYYPLVIVSKETDRIVAVGTLVMEFKFIRNLGITGHIEDIAVDPKIQGKGLGKRIIEALTEVSEALGAYKTILDCSDENQAFYVKCGYKWAGVEMAKYTEKATAAAQQAAVVPATEVPAPPVPSSS